MRGVYNTYTTQTRADVINLIIFFHKNSPEWIETDYRKIKGCTETGLSSWDNCYILLFISGSLYWLTGNTFNLGVFDYMVSRCVWCLLWGGCKLWGWMRSNEYNNSSSPPALNSYVRIISEFIIMWMEKDCYSFILIIKVRSRRSSVPGHNVEITLIIYNWEIILNSHEKFLSLFLRWG